MGGRRNSTRILGRERELAVLADALEGLDEGTPSVVLVSGSAGVGKTRLVDEFVLRAEKIRAVRGGCVDMASPGAYAPWTEILWWLFRGLDDDQLETVVAGNRSHLARLLPALGTPAEDADDGQRALYEAVVDVVHRAGGEIPLTIVVEDAHWIDAASADLLRYLAQNLRRAPVLLIVTYRPENMSPQLRDLTTQLARATGTRIALEPLPVDDAAHLAALLLDAPADSPDVASVVERAEGVPLLVEELAAAGGGQVLPSSVRDLMLVRFATLDADAQTLVRTAATIGPNTRRSLLVEASGLDGEHARVAARAAVDAGILDVDDGIHGYRFHHALLREAVLAEMIPDERVGLHERIAHALLASPERVDADRASELAYHFDAAERGDDAFRWSLTAARLEHERFAYLAAVSHYEHALHWWDRVREPETLAGCDHVTLLTTMSDAADKGGQPHLSLQYQRTALDEVIETDLARAIDIAGIVAVRSWQVGDDYEPIMAWAVNAARESNHSNRASLLALQAGAAATKGRYDDAIAAATEALSMPDIDARAQTRAFQMRATARANLGNIEGALQDNLDGIEAAERYGDPTHLAIAYHNYGTNLLYFARYREAAAVVDDGIKIAMANGLEGTNAGLRALGAEACCAAGDLSGAAALLAPVDMSRVTGYDAATVRLSLGAIARYQGDVEALARIVDDIEKNDIASITSTEEAKRIWLFAEYAAARGDYEAAFSSAATAITDIGQVIEQFDLTALAKTAATARAEIRLHATKSDANPPDVFDLRDRMCLENPAQVAALAFCVAEDARGSRTDTPALWQSALDRADELRIPYDAVICRWRMGECLARDGDKDAARAAYEAAYGQATGIEAAHLVAAIAKSANAIGVRLGTTTKPAAADDRLSLSQRELEVLPLLRAGLTNPEIAEQLFISRRTVRAHLSNIFVKLGATNRTEAVTIAQRKGLID